MFRELCLVCLLPKATCYCEHIQKFDPKIKFVILIHPLEFKRRIATGRMSHLTLARSQLILGHDYSENRRVNEILNDERFHCVVLYPGKSALSLSPLSQDERKLLFPADKELAVFVIDGTWNTARKTMHLSKNLQKLPQICFMPKKSSQFRVRKQPSVECHSTLEAIHHTIELLGESRGFDTKSGAHDSLLHVFGKMVEKQLEYIKRSKVRSFRSRHHKQR